MLQVGHPAPDFKAQAYVSGDFKDVSLNDFKGKWCVLFFYPRDFTFVGNPHEELGGRIPSRTIPLYSVC